MKIIFFGSSNFAVPALEALLAAKHNILCVITQPDRKKGRGLALSATAVKQVALKNKLAIFQPEEVNDQRSVDFLKSFAPELSIVISYGKILSAMVLDIPKLFSINLHASLLPKYRGAAPINWAIIRGEKETGLSIIKMDEKMDAGEVMLQDKIRIEASDTAISLENRLSQRGAKLLLECLVKIEAKKIKFLPQDGSKITFAPKLKKRDGLIDWNMAADDILNLIRGALDWPNAYTYYAGKMLKIFKARKVEIKGLSQEYSSGQIFKVSKEGISVLTKSGGLLIEELQLEGKRRMKVEEFMLGHKIATADRLG